MLCAILLLPSCAMDTDADARDALRELYSESLHRPFSEIKTLFEQYTHRRQFDSVICSARPLYREALRRENPRLGLFAASYLAESYVFTDQYDSAQTYLRAAKQYTDHLPKCDPRILGMNYNTSAVYVMKTRMDYTAAIDYLKKSLDIAVTHADRANECILMSNIASLYYQREDPAGLSYAKKAYELGREMKNPRIMLLNASYLAAMYNFTTNHADALRSIDEALQITRQYPDDLTNRSLVYMTYGDVLAADDQPQRAEQAYKTAVEALGATDESRAIKLYLSYGDFLSTRNRFREAEAQYRKALEIATAINNVEFTHKLLSGLSSVYDHLGDRALALEYHKRYHEAYARVFDLGKEQEFNNLIMKYEQIKHKEEMHLKDLEYAKVKMGITIITAVFLLVLVFSVYSYVLYLKKEKMYAALVTNYNKFSQRITELSNAERERNENMNKTSKKLFDALEVLMTRDKIYRKKDLSLNSVGEMLASNSTYVSKAINTCAGTTFLGYVNSYRMREVVSILSDPTNNEPLKAIADNAGYGNISSFYRYFEKETGCAPSKFRQKMRHLKNGSEDDLGL